MANQNILTYGAKVSQAQQIYFAPVAVIPPFTAPLYSLYCFLARVDPWVDDNNPPIPTQDQLNIKNIFKNMFVIKQIKSSDISPVIKRVDWTSGIIYDYYRDDIDMLAKDQNGFNIKNFYIRNRYDQVFKCLWNNGGAASTVEPYFEPGTYNTNNIFTGSDGYKWKYIYTIDSGSKITFMDSNWIPVPISAKEPNPLLSTVGAGSVDVINVLNGGSGYDTANAIVYATITGDGSGATASPVVVNGVVTDVIVTSPGANYSWANVAITSAIGSGAAAISPTSPVGGHGFDPISELGCNDVMLTCTFTGSESGIIPTDITYHQIGILVNPSTLKSTPEVTSDAILDTSTSFVVASGFGVFQSDEIIFQGNSLATATFTATVLSFDPASNIIKLINTTGTPITNAPVFGNTTKTVRTLLSYNNPNYIPYSGYISFIENRSGIQRSADGIEQFKVVLSY